MPKSLLFFLLLGALTIDLAKSQDTAKLHQRYTNPSVSMTFESGLRINGAGVIESEQFLNYLSTRPTVSPYYGLSFYFPFVLFDDMPFDVAFGLGMTNLSFRTRLQIPEGTANLDRDIDLKLDQQLSGIQYSFKLIHAFHDTRSNGFELLAGFSIQDYLFNGSSIDRDVIAEIHQNSVVEKRHILNWNRAEDFDIGDDTDLQLGIGYRLKLSDNSMLALRLERVKNMSGREFVRNFELTDLGIEYNGFQKVSTDHWTLGLSLLPF